MGCIVANTVSRYIDGGTVWLLNLKGALIITQGARLMGVQRPDRKEEKGKRVRFFCLIETCASVLTC